MAVSVRGGGRKNDDPDTKLSKFLSYVCRHAARRRGLCIDEGGFINVSDILLLPDAQKNAYTLEDVRRVVANCPKQRFSLLEGPPLQIRANQGHSIQIVDLDLTPITSHTENPTVVHGTYYRAWDSIKHQGLNRMKRTHIHFVAGLPGESGVISGMRSSCQVLIYINLRKALEDGIQFFRSSNNVILCAGDANGYLSTKYFEKVVDTSSKQSIDF